MSYRYMIVYGRILLRLNGHVSTEYWILRLRIAAI